MSRSLSYLRRGLLGTAFVGSLGFGITQAVAAPRAAPPIPVACNPYDPFAFEYCSEKCYEYGYGPGTCSRVTGHCECGRRLPGS